MSDHLPLTLSSWMETSTNPVFLASRIELRRNFAGTFFPEKAAIAEKEKAVQEVFWALDSFFEELGRKVSLYFLTERDETEINFLKKKGLISPADVKEGEAVVLDDSEEYAVEINRGDHLTVRVTRAGLHAEDVARVGSLLDAYLSKKLQLSYSKKYGYLTSSLNEVGTGMRLILVGCFPALVFSDRVDELLNLAKNGNKVMVRKVEQFGPANIFHIYNKSTLGLSDDDISGAVELASQDAEKVEMGAREALFKKEGQKFDDRIWKSYGFLEYARLLTYREALYHIATIRMAYGLDLGMEEKVPPKVSSRIFFGTDPDILMVLTNQRTQDPEELRPVRAEWVRGLLLGEKEASKGAGVKHVG
ncbi:MAG: hypothetical protein ACREJQ_07875 [bacterium]